MLRVSRAPGAGLFSKYTVYVPGHGVGCPSHGGGQPARHARKIRICRKSEDAGLRNERLSASLSARLDTRTGVSWGPAVTVLQQGPTMCRKP